MKNYYIRKRSDTKGKRSDTKGKRSNPKGKRSDTKGKRSDTKGKKNKTKKNINHIYLDKNGKRVSKKTIQPYLKMYIAPAYDNVKINKNMNAKVLAIGYDERDRPQYIYNTKCIKSRGKNKFKKLIKFGKEYNNIMKRIENDYKSKEDNKNKQISIILKLIMDCNFRIGNDKYTKENNSFGVSTLLGKHIKTNGGIVVDFVGKKGVQNTCKIVDPKMKSNLRTKKKKYKNTENIFQYTKDGHNYTVKGDDVNEYLGEYTTKNFRTWSANILLITHLLKEKCKIKDGIEYVAKKLHHTPSICKSNYIDPKLLEKYEKNPEKFCEYFKGNVNKRFTSHLSENY
jgi:DNA topoisomerase-1